MWVFGRGYGVAVVCAGIMTSEPGELCVHIALKSTGPRNSKELNPPLETVSVRYASRDLLRGLSSLACSH